jgi:2-keto-4-pentenoate hydratase/2-oxohepta-3-ene-1,7-dioic acid hydratase in catechol pathway
MRDETCQLHRRGTRPLRSRDCHRAGRLSARLQAPDLKTAVGLGPHELESFAGTPCDWAFGDVAWRPDASASLDHEGEIALIIGRPCRGVTAEEAARYVAGYACYNDGGVRDFQMHSNQVTAGKSFVASGAFGPWIVTAGEVPEPSRLTLQTRVNGEVRQRLDMSDLIFGFGELVAYISQIYALWPGDTIATGPPAGIGALTQNWLRAGDRVETEIPAVGTRGNPVVAGGRDAE